MKQKYILIAPPTVPNLITDKYVCLGCGKADYRQRVPVMPLTNINSDGKQSRLNCIIGIHLFAPEEKVTLNK